MVDASVYGGLIDAELVRVSKENQTERKKRNETKPKKEKMVRDAVGGVLSLIEIEYGKRSWVAWSIVEDYCVHE